MAERERWEICVKGWPAIEGIGFSGQSEVLAYACLFLMRT
jgi:hypothetical protein